jgi:glyoxylase-like metal-dependent hydrolase (beta-lactamase superfamily II)
VRELAEGVHSLGHAKGGHVRAFLVDAGGGELTLVDTLFENDGRLIFEALRRLGRRESDVKRIALTHAHRSHLGAVAALKRATGAMVYAHSSEADIVSGDRRAQPVTLRPMQSLRLLPFQIGIRLNRPKHVPCPVDEPLADGDALVPFETLHIPGHSPGHLGFYWRERDLLITGDAVATWPELCPGWKPFTLDERQHAESLRRMALLEPRIAAVGHGEAITEGASERLHEFART